jgi:hypothetical protein
MMRAMSTLDTKTMMQFSFCRARLNRIIRH